MALLASELSEDVYKRIQVNAVDELRKAGLDVEPFKASKKGLKRSSMKVIK